MRLAILSSRGPVPLAMASFLVFLSVPLVHADEAVDAQSVAEGYLKLLDQNDADGAWGKVGEQWKRTTSKAEWMAAARTWLTAKGGAASKRELVVQRAMTPEEARQIAPQSTAAGVVYVFRYRSTYPQGTFFEDVYINRDSDGVLRVGGHRPQPAE